MQVSSHSPTPILVIDQGTTSSRAIIFDQSGNVLAQENRHLNQHYPQNGWVEQDPEEIFQSVVSCCKKVISTANLDNTPIKAIAISNQRETTIVWNKKTGKAIYPAIVWQDRRTQTYCQQLRKQGKSDLIQKKTGLVVDPYFSASKIRWILDNVEGAKEAANTGELLFGTVDTWLLWRLSGGKSHFTDITNASRTQLFNIEKQQWDEELLALFDIPAAMLPEVKDCHGHFGDTLAEFFDYPIPILACIGDQQSALVGQACFKRGMTKSTFGTGCFLMVNTGNEIIHSTNHLLTTIAYRIQGKTHYALEGSIFNAGTVIDWLRDNLQLFSNARESETLARQSNKEGVYFVPAFTGLGAPYWDPDARGAIWGIDRTTNTADLVKAGLDAVCFQSRDLQRAMVKDGIKPSLMRLDGGMTQNSWLMQRLSDILGTPIQRAQMLESTALGAMSLAALELGIFKDMKTIADHWQAKDTFHPAISKEQREKLYLGWQDAISRVVKPPVTD